MGLLPEAASTRALPSLILLLLGGTLDLGDLLSIPAALLVLWLSHRSGWR